MAAKVLILNGPNLNLLGTREPAVYGSATLADIEAACARRGAALGLAVDFRQTNHEGELVDWIQQARGVYGAVLVNAAAFSHTSIAILDALATLEAPVIEVHLSNIFRREPFRRHSYVSRVAKGIVCGFGGFGYEMALEAAAHLLGVAPQDDEPPGCEA